MLFNQQSSMKEKLKSGFESSCDWTSVILNIGRWTHHGTSLDYSLVKSDDFAHNS